MADAGGTTFRQIAASLADHDLEPLKCSFGRMWASEDLPWSDRVRRFWHALAAACAEEADRRRAQLQAIADDLDDDDGLGELVDDGVELFDRASWDCPEPPL